MDEIEKIAENNLDSDDERCPICYSIVTMKFEMFGQREYLVVKCTQSDCQNFNKIIRKVPI
jgi:hypothetical protein